MERRKKLWKHCFCWEWGQDRILPTNWYLKAEKRFDRRRCWKKGSLKARLLSTTDHCVEWLAKKTQFKTGFRIVAHCLSFCNRVYLCMRFPHCMHLNELTLVNQRRGKFIRKCVNEWQLGIELFQNSGTFFFFFVQ